MYYNTGVVVVNPEVVSGSLLIVLENFTQRNSKTDITTLRLKKRQAPGQPPLVRYHVDVVAVRLEVVGADDRVLGHLMQVGKVSQELLHPGMVQLDVGGETERKLELSPILGTSFKKILLHFPHHNMRSDVRVTQ
jgi:hypothetical protein